MTLSFGGGAGVLTIPGVTSDGQTPGGIVVAGAIRAGDTAATSVPTFFTFNGSLVLVDSPGNVPDGDSILFLDQVQPLGADSSLQAAYIRRRGALNGYQYTGPILSLVDLSGSTGPLQDWRNSGGIVAAIGQAGGLGLFGHAAPTAPRTLAQATITAITDANAKAAVQACANALSDLGVLTLT